MTASSARGLVAGSLVVDNSLEGWRQMWGTCDRCRQRITLEASIVHLQHGEVVRRNDGVPLLKAAGLAQLHSLCRPCGVEIAAAVKQFMAVELR